MKVQQVLPAGGWRAVYAAPTWDVHQGAPVSGIRVEPLIGWALYSDDSDDGPVELVVHGGQSLLGIVLEDGRAARLEMADDSSFLGYSAPGEDAAVTFRANAQKWLENKLTDDPGYIERWAHELMRSGRPETPQPASTSPLTESPVLDAYESRRGWEVWCRYCLAWHQHGPGEGHRVAHCFRESPYRSVGYILRLTGPMTDEIKAAACAGQLENEDVRPD